MRTGGQGIFRRPAHAVRCAVSHPWALRVACKEREMTDSTMFADLLAAQKEMPALQKSAINPHFKNRYVPLEELLQTVVPILNKHNFVLLQMPCQSGGDMTPALEY